MDFGCGSFAGTGEAWYAAVKDLVAEGCVIGALDDGSLPSGVMKSLPDPRFRLAGEGLARVFIGRGVV
jgi:hypothetical protein